MKYLPLREFDDVTAALNCETQDCRIVGGCDVYTTKAAGADKKLYKNIESSLESQYASLLTFSASLSSHQAKEASVSLNLTRASPFGPLSQISSRRTFAYLIATLNASHPDYDFSHLLRPSDFQRETSLKKVMHTVDTTLYNSQARHMAPAALEPPHWSTDPTENVSAASLSSSTKWSPRMWSVIDKQMSLSECSIYCYAPEDDPFSDNDEEGAIWSFNYFFFNKDKKRVCYLYIRGLSLMGNETPSGIKTPTSVMSFRTKRPASGSWSLTDGEETGRKRAKFWLGDRADSATVVGDEDDDNDAAIPLPRQPSVEDDSAFHQRGFEGLSDTGSESPCKTRSSDRGRSDSGLDSLSEDVETAINDKKRG